MIPPATVESFSAGLALLVNPPTLDLALPLELKLIGGLDSLLSGSAGRSLLRTLPDSRMSSQFHVPGLQILRVRICGTEQPSAHRSAQLFSTGVELFYLKLILLCHPLALIAANTTATAKENLIVSS